MELLIMIDTCRRASAQTITAVILYFGYAGANRKTQGCESIATKVIANLITKASADRVLACDIHSGQAMRYFDIPIDHVYEHRRRGFVRKLSECSLCMLHACCFQRFEVVKALQSSNGKLQTPILKDLSLPGLLDTHQQQQMVWKPDTTMRIFSGTANSSLAQEITCYMGLDLGKINIERFADGEMCTIATRCIPCATNMPK